MSYKVTDIKQGLYQISSPLGVRYIHQYLMVENESVLLIDVGMKETPTEVLQPALQELDLSMNQLKTVVISHADVDHFSGGASLKDLAKHVTLMAHKRDAPWIESKKKIMEERYFYYEPFGVSHDEETKQWFKDGLQETNVDIQLNGNESIHLGSDRYIDIIHTPGHTPGHLSFYDRKNRACIILDAILWKGLYDVEKKIVSPPPYYTISSYLKSIEKIMSLDIDVLLTGHYDVMTGEDAKQFLQESKEFVTTVEKSILEILNKSLEALSLSEILEKTNEKVGSFNVMMVELVGPVYAHLKDLEAKQQVECIMNGTIPYWKAKWGGL
ncbi:MBL fold metallo-hydrolase [Evansella halocellulosilytica]|uniref:MBL fold metallo-hydrolase n=1 Tax=Evansella halocellulosilytica TaxID=2011013 RepID=UPI000BB6B9BD|nr:MBL fold metallo-hydrolase [Evansella halocellulosilytica]